MNVVWTGAVSGWSGARLGELAVRRCRCTPGFPGVGAKYYTPEITKVKFHRKMTEKPLDNSSENPQEKCQSFGAHN